MNYPEILLVPIIMIADYYLTLIGAKLRERRYAQHWVTKHYELNPIWQKSVSNYKWINARFIFLVIILTVLLYYLTEVGTTNSWLIEGMLGFIFTLYAMIIGRHIYNLLMFRYLDKHSECVEGKIIMSYDLTLSVSQFQTIIVTLPLLVVSLFSGSCFAWGGTVALIVFILKHQVWKMAKRVKPQRGIST